MIINLSTNFPDANFEEHKGGKRSRLTKEISFQSFSYAFLAIFNKYTFHPDMLDLGPLLFNFFPY